MSTFAQFYRQKLADLTTRPEDGQGLTEYVFILTLVAAVVVGSLTFFGSQINSALNSAAGLF